MADRTAARLSLPAAFGRFCTQSTHFSASNRKYFSKSEHEIIVKIQEAEQVGVGLDNEGHCASRSPSSPFARQKDGRAAMVILLVAVDRWRLREAGRRGGFSAVRQSQPPLPVKGRKKDRASPSEIDAWNLSSRGSSQFSPGPPPRPCRFAPPLRDGRGGVNVAADMGRVRVLLVASVQLPGVSSASGPSRLRP